MMVENYNNYSENYMILSLIQCGQPKQLLYWVHAIYIVHVHNMLCGVQGSTNYTKMQ